MDHFGIGTAVQGCAEIYFRSARGTGRTTSLVESLRTGDRVAFAYSREADRVRRLCLERGQVVDCIVVPVDEPNRLRDRAPPDGRLLFDHSWVELFYQKTMEKCREDIDYFQREHSGFGTVHLETRRRAEEIARWRL